MWVGGVGLCKSTTRTPHEQQFQYHHHHQDEGTRPPFALPSTPNPRVLHHVLRQGLVGQWLGLQLHIDDDDDHSGGGHGGGGRTTPAASRYA